MLDRVKEAYASRRRDEIRSKLHVNEISDRKYVFKLHNDGNQQTIYFHKSLTIESWLLKFRDDSVTE